MTVQTDQPTIPHSVAVVPAEPFPLHGGMSVTRYFAMHVMAAVFPVTAGLLLYGWRALIVLLAVTGSAMAAMFIWRRIGMRGRQLGYAQGLWMALLLALILPAHLASASLPTGADSPALWPLLPAAGVGLVIVLWLLGGTASARAHAVLVVYLLLSIFFQHELVPQWVLQRQHVLLGDVLDVSVWAAPAPTADPWVRAAPIAGQDARQLEPAAQQLTFFTSFIDPPERAWLSLEALLRDRMPPLEDLVIGAHPGPIGASSVVAVIIGGLFLLYRGLIDFRIPLLVCLVAMICFLVLPIPVVITEQAREWRWLAMREHGVGWTIAVTFANYQLMAGPMLFMAFFLATDPVVRPMARRGRVVYAVLLGVLAATAQLYISVPAGPYVALLLVSLISPLSDRWFRPRRLV